MSVLKAGDTCRIIAFDHNEEVTSRLHHLGIAQGEVLVVISGSAGSNFLVGAGNNRIALEANLADAITVQRIESSHQCQCGTGHPSGCQKHRRGRQRHRRGQAR